jgi:hypothetical protein
VKVCVFVICFPPNNCEGCACVLSFYFHFPSTLFLVCLIENKIENIPVSDCVDDKTKMGLCVDDEMMISTPSQQHMNNGEQAIQTEMNE